MTRGMREMPLGYGGPQQSAPGQYSGYPSQRSLYDQRSLNPYEQRGPSPFEQRGPTTFDQLGSGPFEQRGTNSLDQRGVNGFDQRQSNAFNQRNIYRSPYYRCLWKKQIMQFLRSSRDNCYLNNLALHYQ